MGQNWCAHVETTMEVTVIRFVLITAVWAACVGCYREPTHPAQVRQNAESRNSSSEPVMPRDSMHAGLSGTPGAIIESREVDIGTLCLTAPDEWVRREPSSQFLLTEFALPKAEGDAEDGRLTVSSAGGTVADNLTRWKGQFGGKPDKESQETIEVAGVKISVVDYTGTFSDQRGPLRRRHRRPGIECWVPSFRWTISCSSSRDTVRRKPSQRRRTRSAVSSNRSSRGGAETSGGAKTRGGAETVRRHAVGSCGLDVFSCSASAHAGVVTRR